MKNTNKNKIKVPAAINGMITGNLVTAASSKVFNNMTNLGSTQLGFNPLNLISSIPGALDVLTGMFLLSNATTGGLAAMLSITDIGKGAATGAQAGMAFGPMGAAIGGGVGLLAGAIGKKGRGASMTSFTDYDEGTLSTGLRAIGGSNKRLRRRRANIKRNAFGNRAAVEGTAALLSDYLDIASELDENTFEQGGMIPSSLAYVDDGELIQTPNGSINAVPEQGNPTDSNLVSLPEGSKVLSDTLKVPGTKKTFAEVGKEMMSNKKVRGKDRFAENSAKLNLMNDNMIHNQLFNLQETMKTKMGTKPKTKTLEGFKDGGLKSNKWLDYVDYAMDAGSMLGELAPSITNLFAKPAEHSNLTSNIYAPSILNTMSRRRFDIEPARRQITQNYGTTNYNADQLNTNTGANMAFRLQNAAATNRAILGLYSQKNNIDNQYRAEYANTMNDLGGQYRETLRYNQDVNRRINAVSDNIRMKGLEGMSAYLQNNRRERNQRRADEAMLPMYYEFLKSGFTDDTLLGIVNNARRTIKKGAKKR